MEGFCRGCLVRYDEPTDLIPYSEKNRRLFIYSTGLQVKRNDTFTFQLCKECYLNMKQSCTFKKQCRNSEKKLKNYMSLKEDGDAIDFCSYIKNCEDLLTIRLPLTSGNSTPAHQKTKEDDNESTCTSIRNFMSDILQGEEVPDTEARIIRELIEEEADVLDDSLDSHWLQDDMSIETDFRMDFNFSPFSTPRSIQNDHCYTPKRLNDDRDDYFTLKQIDKPPDEQYHMPILDDCDIDIDQPASIPMDIIKTDCYTQQKSRNYEINNLNVNGTEFDSYNGVKIENFIVDNVKDNEIESENYGLNDLKLNETESQNYEIKNLNIDETECESYVEIQHFEVIKHDETENQNYEMKDLKLNEMESKNYEIDNLNVDETKCDSYVKIDDFDVNNVKHDATENQNYEMKDLKLNETEIQNYEIDNTVKINVNNKETYFVEQMTEIETNKREDDFLNIGDKTQDFIAITETENDFYNITNNSNQSKVKTEIDDSMLNNELEYYISKAELKKKSNLVSNKCLIDINLEKALENEDNKEIPLDILISSPKVDIRSGASTPTIRNILFGDTILDSDDSPKLGQCIEKFQPIEGQTNILDDFLKDEDSNIGNLKVKEEIDLNLNSHDLVKNKVEIIDIKIIKERDDEANNLEEEKSEDIRDLIEDYVTNVYDNINTTENVEIDALELLKATNATLDDSIFKKPLSPLYNKYDLETSQCKICNKNFKTQINLKIHFAKKHKFKIVGNITNVDLNLTVCNICGSKLKGKANLNRHKKRFHKGEFSCTECLLSFPTELGLNIHKRKHKEEVINNTPKEYARNSICNICGKKMTASHYKLHVLRHLKDFKFKCELCDKGFYRPSDYKNHLRTHTNTRPFECKICTKSYKLRASLNLHYDKVHSVKQKFMCDFCSATFESKRMLKSHFGTKMCNPAHKTSEEQSNLVSKTSDKKLTPNNKTSVKQRKPAKQTSEEQCNSANESSEEHCYPDKTSMEQCNLDNKTLMEQCIPANESSEEHCNPNNKTLMGQCNPDNKTSMEQCNPDNKTSMEQCNPDNKTSEKQCNPANKTSEEQCNSANKMPEVITEETDIVTEEIEFNMKLSPISFKDEHSDPNPDLLYLN